MLRMTALRLRIKEASRIGFLDLQGRECRIESSLPPLSAQFSLYGFAVGLTRIRGMQSEHSSRVHQFYTLAFIGPTKGLYAGLKSRPVKRQGRRDAINADRSLSHSLFRAES
jgi:hypothetical protein